MEKLIDLVGLNIFKEQIKNKINLTYDTSTTRINIKFGTEVLSYIDARPFIVDGMLNKVTVVSQNDTGAQGTFIKFEFNADAEKSIIYINVTDILKDVISKIEDLELELSNKVNKEEGKGLSQNDFTNGYKEMLDNIATEADIISLFV